MAVLRYVRGVIQEQEPLNVGGDEVGRKGQCGLPAEDVKIPYPTSCQSSTSSPNSFRTYQRRSLELFGMTPAPARMSTGKVLLSLESWMPFPQVTDRT